MSDLPDLNALDASRRCAMLDLEALEVRVDRAAGWMVKGMPLPWDGFKEARDLAVEQNRALIAEVRVFRLAVDLLAIDLSARNVAVANARTALGA